MRRREFITLLAGATASWPLVARAQQPERVRRIGVLMGLAASDPDASGWISAFEQVLQKSGWSEGRNIKIEYRWGTGDARIIRAYAAELIGLAPEVIVTRGSTASRTMQQETKSIPILFVAVSDPVGSGFVASLAHPGGNITGFANHEDTMAAKWLELLKEIAPEITRVAVVHDPGNPPAPVFLRAIDAAASSLGVQADAGWRARRGRDRAGHRDGRPRAELGAHRPDRRGDQCAPRIDYQIGGSVPFTCGVYV